MADADAIFAIPGRSELITERCDLRCAWCEFCHGRDIPAERLQSRFAQPLPAGTPLVRLRGGDPFRYGDLAAWVEWVRRQPGTAVCVEGHAATLAADDRAALVQRIIAARPDAVSAVLPTMDAARTEALTRVQWDPARVLDGLRVLRDAGIAVEIVFPVHPATIAELTGVVLGAGSRLDGVTITLRRSPSVGDGANGSAVDHDAADWPELAGLSAVLATLPPALPGDARLQLDPGRGYAACMLQPAARRRDLFDTAGQAGRHPLGAVCADCAMAPRCTFRADSGVPPAHRVQPLSVAQARELEAAQRSRMGAQPHRFHTDRASVGLPNLLCFAPWTTLSVCEPRFHAVPCALSWVETDMTPEQIVAEVGSDLEDERERAAIAHREIDHRSSWYVTENERVSLMELWNSPLLRLMRREMTGGEKSSRCRTMCRVVMGVEERGISNFQRPDDELTPAIVANRRLLLEEIHAGKSVLTAKPLDLMIGVSAHCNISCGFCDGPLGAYGDLSDRRREEIIALLPTLMSFGVSGPGEPLMNKNFLALLAHISDHGYPALSLSLTTNGTLLTPEFLARNANVPWGSVRVSLNAGSAATWERMTGKPYFERVLRNLDALCALRDRRERSFSVTLSLVLGSVQMGDLMKFAQIVHDHRTAIIIEPMNDDKRELSPWVRPPRLAALADELHSVAEAFVEKNPDISRAFRAVEGFARTRLQSQDFEVLKGH
jgi:MoaA/NifB/PqqE/SkfB family radical SAM enzyme